MEGKEKGRTFAPLSKRNRALSSAGSERLPYKQRVGGSNPSAPTTTLNVKLLVSSIARGRLAQLVQSVCLTSRGSAVRIRQRPLDAMLLNPSPRMGA